MMLIDDVSIHDIPINDHQNTSGLLPEELEIFTDLFEKLRRWGLWEVKQSSEIFDSIGKQ